MSARGDDVLVYRARIGRRRLVGGSHVTMRLNPGDSVEELVDVAEDLLAWAYALAGDEARRRPRPGLHLRVIR